MAGHPAGCLRTGPAFLAVLLACAAALPVEAVELFGPASWRLDVAGEASAVALGDFNGDGITDIAVASATSKSVAVFAGDAGSGFVTESEVPVAGGASSLVSADFDGDGRTDLVVAGPTGEVHVILGGASEAARVASLGSGSSSMAATDVNGDGAADVVIASWESGSEESGSGRNSVSVLIGDGSGRLTLPGRPWRR